MRAAAGLVALAAALAGVANVPARATVIAQEIPRAEQRSQEQRGERARSAQSEELGRLLDAVVERTARSFWDKELLERVRWRERAGEVRQSIVAAPSLEEAARRINALLGELRTSHTGLFTPDDVEYYILLDVFGGAKELKELVNERFGGSVTYEGAGMFSARVDDRDFVDAVLEQSPAERAGLKAGDEIVSIDERPYHPIRSFQGKAGREVAVRIRRVADGPVETIKVRVVRIDPLEAFRNATLASARVVEREGERIGYVHVWASVGDDSAKALTEALKSLGVNREGRRRGNAVTELDGLIIDMRGKIGGTGSNAGRYLDVIDPRGPDVRSRNKEHGGRMPVSLRGRTAVLIDHHTRSTAELFVHAYKRERQGPLIGTRTAGAASAAAAFAMPGGNLLYLAVVGLEIDREIVEGVGVAPDVEVARPLPYAQGADPVLETAATLLAEKAKARVPPPQDAPGSSN